MRRYDVTHPSLGALWLLRPTDFEANLIVLNVDGSLGLGVDNG